MKQKLILRQEAEQDLAMAHAWHNEKVPGLGAEFLAVVERTLESIQDNPARFPLIYRELRRALIRRFPYGVFFVCDSRRITVLAVMHTAREPGKWQRRL
jgi:plasmid stabilization system protein ParE